MDIKPALVKELRERTGAGMMECKKALVETSGDLEAAAEIMRKSGLAKADKKAGRIAAEGSEAVGSPPSQLTALITAERAKWEKVIKAAGIKGDE